jgi:ribosome maturation factor RimP
MEKQQIAKKIEEIVSSLGYLLIDLVFRGDHHLFVIELYIDNETGITTDDCSTVSRAVNEIIELEKLIDSSYRLDVSSPGTERPLKYLTQYSKHLNRKFEVEYKDDEEIKKLTGKFVRMKEADLFFEEKKNEIKINFEKVIKAKVIISF